MANKGLENKVKSLEAEMKRIELCLVRIRFILSYPEHYLKRNYPNEEKSRLDVFNDLDSMIELIFCGCSPEEIKS